MVINKNFADVATYYSFSMLSREEIQQHSINAVAKVKEALREIKRLGGLFALEATTVDMHFDGFIIKIAGHHGDIAWHESTCYKYETYGTVADGDDVTHHDTIEEAVTALLRTPE